MMFTGLLDKSGKDIYEGDIVKDHRKMVFRVKFYLTDDGSGFQTDITDDGCVANLNDNDIEIIGNIYENPELLTNYKEV